MLHVLLVIAFVLCAAPDVALADMGLPPLHVPITIALVCATLLAFVSAGIAATALRLLKRSDQRNAAEQETTIVAPPVTSEVARKLPRAFFVKFTISLAIWFPLLFVLLMMLLVKEQEDNAYQRNVVMAHQALDVIALALDNYRLDAGEYPGTLGNLVQSASPGWKGPYLQSRHGKLPKDPWGNEYFYRVLDGGGGFELFSTGNGNKRISYDGRDSDVLSGGRGR